MTNEQAIRDLKEEFAARKTDQIRVQTRLDESKKRRKDILARIKEEGLSVKTLPKEIESLKVKIDDGIEEVKALLDAGNEKEDEDLDFS